MSTKYKRKKCGCETVICTLGDPVDFQNDPDVSVIDEREILCDKHKNKLLVKKWAGHHIVIHENDYGLVVNVAQENEIKCFITDKDFAVPYAAYLNYRFVNQVDEDGEKVVRYPQGTDLSKRNVGPHLPSRRKRSYPNQKGNTLSIIRCGCGKCRKDDPNGRGFIWKYENGFWKKLYAVKAQKGVTAMPQKCANAMDMRDRIGCDCEECKQFWIEYYNEVPNPIEEALQ